MPLDDKLRLDIVKSVVVKDYIRADIDEQNRLGLFAQELQAAVSENVPSIESQVIQSGDILTVNYGGLVCILWGAIKEIIN